MNSASEATNGPTAVASSDEREQALREIHVAEQEILRGEVDLERAVEELETIENRQKHEPVHIFVNTNIVEMPRSRATGLEIKERAIAAGVAIELDFVLFEKLPDGREEIVKDDRIVNLHHEHCFEAIDNDDHS